MTDEEYMRLALDEAERAAALDEVPVGAVVVRRGEILARAHNTRETGKCALDHAELLAIRDACRAAGGWRLNDTTLYGNLNRTANSAAQLVEDLKAHPKRYVHFSVFGKKEKPVEQETAK